MPFKYPYQVRRACRTVGLVFLLSLPCLVLAETKTIISEATYLMGDGETPVLAESRVLQKAKRIALEQVGTYVESYTKVRNLELTNEEIQTIAGGVIAVKILEQSRKLVRDVLQLSVKIEATVISDKMEELARRIKNRNVAEEYNKLQKEYAQLAAELERSKQEAALAKDQKRLEAALEEIRENDRKYGKLQQSENALLQRLVSGSDLLGKAEASQNRIDDLIKNLLAGGVRVEVGVPTSQLTGATLGKVAIGVPLKINVTDSIIREITAQANSLGGTVYHDSPYIFLRIAKDRDLSEYFVARMTSVAVIVTLQFNDGSSLSCVAARPFRNSLYGGTAKINPSYELSAIFELQKERVLQLTQASAATEITNKYSNCKLSGYAPASPSS